MKMERNADDVRASDVQHCITKHVIVKNQIKFISLKNSMNITTVERITVSRNSKVEVALTAVLDHRPSNITTYQLWY